MKIIRVEPTTPMTSLTWMIGIRCNYDCSYCPPRFHDNHSPHPDLAKLKQAWDNYYAKTKHIELPYKLSFTGGEVTANKSFLPLIEYIREGDFNVGQIIISTNGSASKAYYLKLAKLVDNISFSTHAEFWDEAKFVDTVIAVNQYMLSQRKTVHVNIMDEELIRDRLLELTETLKQHNVNFSINRVNRY